MKPINGEFRFFTSRPVTESEGKELEAILMNWALRNGMRIGSYFYNTEEVSRKERDGV